MLFFSSFSSLLLLLAASSQSNVFTKATTLITFDVDGTLIHGTGSASNEGAHAQAFQHALQHVLVGEGVSSTGDKTSIPGVAEALDRRLYHGSTDGLILLRYARAALQVEPRESFPKLNTMMEVMFDYIQELDNTAVSKHLAPLPGVIENLQKLAKLKDQVKCALVTGNVEGIARRKMDAVGIFATGALHPPCHTQKEWPGTEHLAFLGGFGSDYCSGNIDDMARNHLDRCEQIAIAAERCQNLCSVQDPLKRVVHVGDAPADVLAAKALSERNPDYCVGMVAVATGSYTVEELTKLAGTPIPGKWEPVVLEKGMNDPNFLKACGIELE